MCNPNTKQYQVLILQKDGELEVKAVLVNCLECNWEAVEEVELEYDRAGYKVKFGKRGTIDNIF